MHVVVNWLWQGVALTLVAAAALWSAPRLSATTRYLIWWTTLILVLIIPALPSLMMQFGVGPEPVAAMPPLAALPLPVLPAWPTIAALLAWTLWVAVSLLRVVASLCGLWQARRAATAFPIARELRLTHWSSLKSRGRRARLVSSHHVASAAVLGLGPAVIAVSPSAAARLTDAELDQVLVHEWAHVQRRDDYARLAQIVIRMAAGLHPAVWWIGRRLEIEREIACDDYAVNIAGAAQMLARCLTKLAEGPQRALRATLAPGMLASSQLTLRVRSLLDTRRNTSTAGARATLGSLTAALAVLAVVLSHLELVVAASPLVVPTPQAPAVAATTTVSQPTVADDAQQSRAGDSDANRKAPRSGPAPRATGRPADDTRDVTPRVAPAGIAPLYPALPLIDSNVWPAPALPAAPVVETVSANDAPAAGRATSAPERTDETPWGAAADAGISVGRGSQKAATATADAGTAVGRGTQKAAVATAGFFSRFGKRIAGGF